MLDNLYPLWIVIFFGYQKSCHVFLQACKFLDEKWSPTFVVIVAQKNHHTKFFQPGSPDNVPPGKPKK